MTDKAKRSLGYWLGLFVFVVFAPPVGAYDEVAVANGGSISGLVKLQGKVPKPEPLEVTKNRELCGKVMDERLVVGVGQGVRYAVVTLEGISRGKAIEREAAHELDNVKCRFAPHLQAAGVGQFLLLKNSDAILHTAHAYTPEGQPQFNVGLYPGRVSRKPLISAGLIKVLCEVHPWMSAYIVVKSHPYYGVTDGRGNYSLSGIALGKYRLEVWHAELGTKAAPFELVREGEVLALDVEMKK